MIHTLVRPLSLSLAIVLAAGAFAAPVLAQMASLNPSQDCTLYEEPSGALSNGAGEFFFAGVNANAEIRRGVIAFEVADTVPAGSTITSATLTLEMTMNIAGSVPVSLHPLLADWGEGTSNATMMGGGMGAPSTAGDATWIHTFFDTGFWGTAGGDFAAAPSATQMVDDLGTYTWSSAQMAADAQAWLDDPASNFGWLVRGDESGFPTTKRFNSRENAAPATVPVLTLTWNAPPVQAIPTLTVWGVLALAALVGGIALWRLRWR